METELVWIWQGLALLLWIIGVAGCFLPILPGPLLAYASLWMYVFLPEPFSISWPWLVFWGFFTALVMLLDFVLPGILVKRFKGSQAGIRGANWGAIIGLFFGPPGILMGPLVGAMLGELSRQNSLGTALSSGLAAFLAFFLGTGIKLMVAAGIGIHVFIQVVQLLLSLR